MNITYFFVDFSRLDIGIIKYRIFVYQNIIDKEDKYYIKINFNTFKVLFY